ncbi:hypothetical protein ES708_12833 [subsurface metagenome]
MWVCLGRLDVKKGLELDFGEARGYSSTCLDKVRGALSYGA